MWQPLFGRKHRFGAFFRIDAGIKKLFGAEWQNRRLGTGECTVFNMILETSQIAVYFCTFRGAKLELPEFSRKVFFTTS